VEIQFACSSCGSRLVLGQELAGREVRCPKCGATSYAPGGAPAPIPVATAAPAEAFRDQRPCPFCGELIEGRAQKCRFCNEWLNPQMGQMQGAQVGLSRRSRVAAGVLGIFLGGLGIHRFYLGSTGIGVIQLLLGLGGCATFGLTSGISGIWGLIEGILILVGGINTDGDGNQLRN